MRGRAALLGLLILCGCDRRGGTGAPEAEPTGAGERLEAAARAQGLVPDPAAGTLTGVWSRETDRLCIVDPAPGTTGLAPGEQRIGVVTDFGDGQGCIASGGVRRRGDTLAIQLGRCRFAAKVEAGRIVFPGTLPAGCDGLCRGRASLTGLDVERDSESASEAVMLRSRGGRRLCD